MSPAAPERPPGTGPQAPHAGAPDASRQVWFLPALPGWARWHPAAAHRLRQAAQALHHWFTLAPQRIDTDHLDALAWCWRAAGRQAGRLLRPVRILDSRQALEDAALCAAHPGLPALLARCQADELGRDLLADAASDGACRLPSPFSLGQAAHASLSLALDKGSNALHFTDGAAQRSFFLLQNISSADSLYLPGAHVLIYLAHARQADVRALWQALVERLPALRAQACGAAPRRWGGVLVSNHRPGHFFHESLPALWRLVQQDEALAARLPAVIQRHDHDFLDLAPLLPGLPHQRLPADELVARSLAGAWFIHLGDNPHRRLARQGEQYALAAWLMQRLAAIAPTQPQAEAAPATATANMGAGSDVPADGAAALSGCHPVLWLGIEGQKRCWLEQVEGLALLVARLAAQHPRLGVVIDGWTLPLTPGQRNRAEAATDAAVARDLLARLPSGVRTLLLVGADSATKLRAAARVDAFVANFAGGSLHVSQLAGRPGFAHLSRALARHSLAHGVQPHLHRQVQLLPLGLVEDRPQHILRPRAPAWAPWWRSGWGGGGALPSAVQAPEMAALSYSIAPEALCGFVLARLPALLAPPLPALRCFIEPSFAIHPDVRHAIRAACLGRMALVFPTLPEAPRPAALAGWPPQRLAATLVYGLFSPDEALALGPSCELLVWLDEPLRRAQRHALQFIENARQAGQTLSLDEVLAAGHKALDNYLVRLLSGQDADFGRCDEGMLDRALARVRAATFVGFAGEPAGTAFGRLCCSQDWDPALFPDSLPSQPPVPPAAFSPAQLARLRGAVRLDERLYAAAWAHVHGSQAAPGA